MLLTFLSVIDSKETRSKLEQIYINYKKDAYWTAYNILKDHHRAEDVVQDAIIRMSSLIDKIEEVKCNKTRALFVIIVRNLSINIYNRRKNMESTHYEELDVESKDLNLDEEMIRLEQVEWITTELEKIEVPKSLDKWFSKFNRKLDKEQRKSKYKNIISKVAIVFLILFVSIATLTVTVEAFRVRFLNIIIENTQKYLGVEVGENGLKVNESMESLKTDYMLEYIPEGFKTNSVKELDKTKVITYTNEVNEEIIFNQSPNGTKFQMDSENAIRKDVYINGEKGIALIKDDLNILFWHDEEYSFYLLSTAKLEQLISMAESLNKK